jgi:E3 ubiquitin-protein ligase NEDD4
VRELDGDERRRLLRGVTGLAVAPFGGFAALQPPFTLQLTHDGARLPVAHTCFNRLDLPRYASKAQLQEKLGLFIAYADAGFHVV